MRLAAILVLTGILNSTASAQCWDWTPPSCCPVPVCCPQPSCCAPSPCGAVSNRVVSQTSKIRTDPDAFCRELRRFRGRSIGGELKVKFPSLIRGEIKGVVVVPEFSVTVSRICSSPTEYTLAVGAIVTAGAGDARMELTTKKLSSKSQIVRIPAQTLTLLSDQSTIKLFAALIHEPSGEQLDVKYGEGFGYRDLGSQSKNRRSQVGLRLPY